MGELFSQNKAEKVVAKTRRGCLPGTGLSGRQEAPGGGPSQLEGIGTSPSPWGNKHSGGNDLRVTVRSQTVPASVQGYLYPRVVVSPPHSWMKVFGGLLYMEVTALSPASSLNPMILQSPSSWAS